MNHKQRQIWCRVYWNRIHYGRFPISTIAKKQEISEYYLNTYLLLYAMPV